MLFVCLVVLLETVSSSEVLMQPYAYGMNSRFRDNIMMAEVLVERGHHVTVLINSDDKVSMEHINVRFISRAFNIKNVNVGYR